MHPVAKSSGQVKKKNFYRASSVDDEGPQSLSAITLHESRRAGVPMCCHFPKRNGDLGKELVWTSPLFTVPKLRKYVVHGKVGNFPLRSPLSNAPLVQVEIKYSNLSKGFTSIERLLDLRIRQLGKLVIIFLFITN
ncbi:hypothetical protein AMTRI_Chr12g271220 [Amborella trichopoda]